MLSSIKLIILYFIVAAYWFTFSQQNVNELISFKCNDLPLRSAVRELQAESGFNFIFNDKLLNEGKKVTCNFNRAKLKHILNGIFDGSDVSFKLFGSNSIVLYKSKNLRRPEYTAKIIEEKIPVSDAVHSYSEAKMISDAEPHYPLGAVINRTEGKVTIKLFVNSRGNVSNALIEYSSKSAILDSASLRYAYKQKFIPAKINGRPVNSWYIITFLYTVIDSKQPF